MAGSSVAPRTEESEALGPADSGAPGFGGETGEDRVGEAGDGTLHIRLNLPPGYPHEHQRRLSADTHRFRLMVSGIQGGKTTWGTEESLALALEGKPGLDMIVAPDYPLLRQATMRKVFEVWPRCLWQETWGGAWHKSDRLLRLGDHPCGRPSRLPCSSAHNDHCTCREHCTSTLAAG